MSPVHMDRYSLISTMLGLPNGILKFSSLLSYSPGTWSKAHCQ